MIKLIIVVVLLLAIILNVGYYKVSHENSPDTRIFFIKKFLTLRVEFINLATVSWGGDPPFTDDDLQAAIDYCKYRLGIETKLSHPDDLRRCSGH